MQPTKPKMTKAVDWYDESHYENEDWCDAQNLFYTTDVKDRSIVVVNFFANTFCFSKELPVTDRIYHCKMDNIPHGVTLREAIEALHNRDLRIWREVIS